MPERSRLLSFCQSQSTTMRLPAVGASSKVAVMAASLAPLPEAFWTRLMLASPDGLAEADRLELTEGDADALRLGLADSLVEALTLGLAESEIEGE